MELDEKVYSGGKFTYEDERGVHERRWESICVESFIEQSVNSYVEAVFEKRLYERREFELRPAERKEKVSLRKKLENEAKQWAVETLTQIQPDVESIYNTYLKLAEESANSNLKPLNKKDVFLGYVYRTESIPLEVRKQVLIKVNEPEVEGLKKDLEDAKSSFEYINGLTKDRDKTQLSSIKSNLDKLITEMSKDYDMRKRQLGSRHYVYSTDIEKILKAESDWCLGQTGSGFY